MISSLILANVIVFIAELFAGDTLLRSFALWPPGAAGIGADGGLSPWQLVTYAFLHGVLRWNPRKFRCSSL